MRKNIPTVRNGILIEDPVTGHDRAIEVGSAAWLSWLETAQHFAFEDPAGRFTARKKPRGGTLYWYAFKRREGRYRETYIGKSANIGLETLRSIPAKLDSPGGQHGVEPPPAESAAAEDASPEQSRDLDWRTLGLLPTKLAMPRVNAAQLVSTRMTERLASALEHPLTVVSAPPGYGKTTLLAQWIRTSGLSAAWVSLDATDNDPSMLATYLCTALDRVVPGLFETVRPLLHVNHAQVPSAKLTALIHELADAPDPTVLVLDDYHRIASDNTFIHETISYLVEHLPEQVHLILASRVDPPLPLARLRTRGQLLELRATDLAFTPEESRIFLTERMGLDMPAEQIDALHERTEGWIGALQLAALSLRERPEAASSLASSLGESRYMVEYLVEEVLQRLPPEMRSFLLRVALLDRLTAPLCDTVTASTSGKTMLAAMERANLFLVPLDGQLQWYRFHGLFATAVRHYVREHAPEIVPQVYVRASAWCEANDHLGEAIAYAFAANDLGHAAVLLESFAEIALGRGYLTLLGEMLSRLPEEIVRERPRLCVARAYVLLLGGDRRVAYPQWVWNAGEALGKTAPLLKQEDRAILQGEILALRASLAHAERRTKPQTSIAMFQQALALLPEPHPLRNLAHAYLGLNHILDGNVRAASQTLKGLLRTSEASGDVLYIGASTLYLCLASVLEGRLDDALALCDRLTYQIEGPGVASLEGAIHLVMGVVLHERNEVELAFDHLSHSLAVPFDLTLPLYIGCPALASVYSAQGNHEEARRTMEQGVARWELMQAGHIHAYEWAGRLIQAQQARLWLLMGDVAAAADWVRQRERWVAEDLEARYESPSFLRELEELALAHAHLAQGRPDEALALLGPLSAAAEEAGRNYRLLKMLVLQAVAHAALDDMALALQTLGRALALAAPGRCIRTFVDGGPTVKRLLARLLRELPQHTAAISSGFLEELVTALGLEEQAISGTRHRRSNVAMAQLSTAQRVRAHHERAQRERPHHSERLTPREAQVLALVERGLTNKEIAQELPPMKLTTVKRHVENIYSKLDAHNRTQAVNRARALGLLPGEPGGPEDGVRGRTQPWEVPDQLPEPFDGLSPG